MNRSAHSRFTMESVSDHQIDDSDAENDESLVGSSAPVAAARQTAASARLRDAAQFEIWKTKHLKYQYLTLLATAESSDSTSFRVVCETCKVRLNFSVSFVL